MRINHALYLERGEDDNRAGAIYVVTHIDVIPPGKEACMAALKGMSSDTADDRGNIGYAAPHAIGAKHAYLGCYLGGAKD